MQYISDIVILYMHHLASESTTLLKYLRWHGERVSLVAAVPLPGIARSAWQEVGCSLVLHPLWKA